MINHLNLSAIFLKEIWVFSRKRNNSISSMLLAKLDKIHPESSQNTCEHTIFKYGAVHDFVNLGHKNRFSFIKCVA
jgi:hypothetical protein